MKTLMKYSALLALAVVLLPTDGFAQGRGQGQGGNQAQAGERAQVERGQTDRDRMRDRDRTHQSALSPSYEGARSQERKQEQGREQARQQEQIHVPGEGNGPDSDIYGHEMMTIEERNQYREQLRLVESDPDAKNRFLKQHQEQMQVRARAQGADTDAAGEKEEAE